MSIMQAHQQRVRDGEVSSASAANTVIDLPKSAIADQQLVQLITDSLGVDLRNLKELNSIERKVELKRDILVPKYEEYVAALQAKDLRHELVGYFVIWLFDIGEVGRAIELALWCVERGQGTPEGIHSDIQTFAATNGLSWAAETFKQGSTPEPYFGQLFAQIDGLCGPCWDIADNITAGYYKLQAELLEAVEKYHGAVDCYEVAYAMKSTVKTALGKARKKLAQG